MVKLPPPFSPSDSSFSSEDRHLWERVKALTKPLSPHQVAHKLRDTGAPLKIPPDPKKKSLPKHSTSPIPFVQFHIPTHISPIAYEKTPETLAFNPHTFNKISKRSFRFSAILDLHGQSLDSAFRHFSSFILKNYHLNQRFLLIITGKGRGFLRSAFTEWCFHSDASAYIISMSQASSFHGGAGAFYLVLKKSS